MLSFSELLDLRVVALPTKLKPNPLNLIFEKEKILEKLSEILSEEEKERALNDPHARRSPRWCGLTIHVGLNCPFNCSYCYIEDMGFKKSSWTDYPLSGKELLFAIANNPAFFPGRLGTLLAIGSITDPMGNPIKFLDYLSNLAELGNPIQFSTKGYISPRFAEKIKEIEDEKKSKINPLITIITLENSKILERGTPTPEKRLKSIENLSAAGLRPILFLRPIMPGINTMEIEDIIDEAKERGAKGVVFGSLRVTRKIIANLEDSGFDTNEIRRRVKRIDEKQRSIPLPEKEFYIKIAKEKGIIAWKSTCCTNSWNSNVPCPSVCFIDGPTARCPNLCTFPDNSAEDDQISKALVKLGVSFKIRGRYIIVKNRPFRGVEFAVRTLTRRAVKMARVREKSSRET